MRFLSPTILAGGLLAASLLASGHAAAADPFDEVLETSLKDKKGVVVYVAGQAIPGRVIRVTAETVELSSREYPRIVVKRDRINAVASN